MEHERKKLATELETYRQAIVKAVDEIQEMEIVLDRTTTLHMEALKERKQMINQWTQSISILQQRDTDIQNCLRVGFLYFFFFYFLVEDVEGNLYRTLSSRRRSKRCGKLVERREII